MKNKTFGNIINEPIISKNQTTLNDSRFKNNGIEFLTPDDRQSARDINRPIRQLYEDVENNYELFQVISKIVLGDKKVGIIPDILEEFNANNLIVGSYYYRNEPFLRIPSGAFIINNLSNRDEGIISNIEDLKPKYLSTEGNDFAINNYVVRDRNSAFVINKPKIELYERELADHYNIDLSEQDNNISVDYKLEKGILKYSCYATQNIFIDGSLTTKKIDINQGKEFKNIFELTTGFYNSMNHYVNTDGYYSLEETIPLKGIANGEYTLFFRAGDYNTVSTYSLSGNYGISLTKDSNKYKDSDIKLFTFNLYNGVISNKKCLIEKINRSALDIKNLNISNNYITVDETAWHLCTDSQIKDMI